MAISLRYFKPALIIGLYELITSLMTKLYGLKFDVVLFCHNFSDPEYDVTGWFVRDMLMLSPALMLGLCAMQKDVHIRNFLVMYFLLFAVKKCIQILIWDNNLTPISFGFSIIFSLLSIYLSYAYANRTD